MSMMKYKFYVTYILITLTASGNDSGEDFKPLSQWGRFEFYSMFLIAIFFPYMWKLIEMGIIIIIIAYDEI